MDFNVPLKEIQVSSSAISPQNTTIKPSEPSPVIDHVVILPNGTIRHNYEVDLSETITFRTELSGSHFIYYKYERYMWSLHGLTVLRNVLEQFKEDRENIVAMFIALAGMSAILLGLIRNRKILPHSR